MNEAQIEETEVLSSIYGEEAVFINQEGRSLSVTLELAASVSGMDPLPPLQVDIYLPESYPTDTTAMPIFTYNAPWLQGGDHTTLSSGLASDVSREDDQPILFSALEWLRSDGVESLSPPLAERGNNALSSVATTYGVNADTGNDYDNSNSNNNEDDDDDDDDDPGQVVVDCPDIISGPPVTDRRSKFVGHYAAVTSREEVEAVIHELYQDKKIATATHNIYAWRIKDDDTGQIDEWREDDGETNAGDRLLSLLQLRDLHNIFVMTTRWYGGVHLGPDRFKHITARIHELMDSGAIEVSRHQDAPAGSEGGGAGVRKGDRKGKKGKKSSGGKHNKR